MSNWSAAQTALNAFIYAWLKRVISELKREIGPALKGGPVTNQEQDAEIIRAIFEGIRKACDRMESESIVESVRKAYSYNKEEKSK